MVALVDDPSFVAPHEATTTDATNMNTTTYTTIPCLQPFTSLGWGTVSGPTKRKFAVAESLNATPDQAH